MALPIKLPTFQYVEQQPYNCAGDDEFLLGWVFWGGVFFGGWVGFFLWCVFVWGWGGC